MAVQLLMETELYRLSSFASWPENLPARPPWLARIGFFYSVNTDEVECFICNIRLDKCMTHEMLEAIHKQKSPQCNLLRGNDKENFPLKIIDTDRNGASTTTDHCFQVDGPDCSYAANIAVDGAARDSPRVLNSKCDTLKALTDLYKKALLRANRKHVFSTEVVNSSLDRLNPDYILLKKEEVRLGTFNDWPPRAHVSREALAREGLFYVGQKDCVRCAFCRGILQNWEPTDVPSEEHKKLHPDCPFVRGLNVGNVPLDNFPVDKYGADSTHPKSQAQQQQLQSMQIGNPSTQTDDNRVATLFNSFSLQDPPAHPKFVDKATRIKSFPQGVSTGQDPQTMATAGWFFFGPGDKVVCFQCGGNLKNWQPQDDPWDEHKRWYPDCAYLKTNFPVSRPIPQPSQLTIRANYQVEPREIKARMDTPTVRAILDMGYARDKVRNAIEHRLSSIGDDFPNAESLLEALFQLDASASNESMENSSTASGFRTMSVSSSAPSASSSVATSGNSISYVTDRVHQPSLDLRSSASLASQSSSATALAATASTSETIDDAQSKSKGKRKRNKKKKMQTFADVPASSAAGVDEAKVNSFDADKSTSENTFDEIPDEDADKYLEENRQLREARTCKVCMDAEVNTVFLPCGHLVCCNNCSPQLRNCPICRTFIRGTVKTFLS